MTSLTDLNRELLMCRTLGHAWDTFNPNSMRPPEFGDRLSLRCTRCTTERHDICSWADGSLVARSYIYPDNYRLASRYFRNDYRLALIGVLNPRRRQAMKATKASSTKART